MITIVLAVAITLLSACSSGVKPQTVMARTRETRHDSAHDEIRVWMYSVD